MKTSSIALPALVASLFVLSACSGTGDKTANDGASGAPVSGSGTSDTGTAAPAAGASTTSSATVAKPNAMIIYFDYDRSDLDSSDTRVLDGWAKYLAANPNARLVIEGHCDERGSKAYNLSLGERRAASARDYLASSGVARGQLSVTSYGEERPVADGSNESAWSQNRRVELKLQ